MLQNRGALFTLEPNHPNTLAPRKRPLHAIIPDFMEKEGTRIAFGIMGGWNQAQAHAQFVADVVDFGLTPRRRSKPAGSRRPRSRGATCRSSHSCRSRRAPH
jgi:gamma-glutamyltranspeptidase